ncbi:MAG: inositol monophosphatase family protein, partial [Bacteroidota bacterium]|nr:inositol monophosphatase family protein [Bacteroidota bacterium]
VTYVDKNSERLIVNGLSGLINDSGFIVEENTVEKEGDVFNWIIDPLDGTTNFIHSVPCFSISIALKQEDKIVVGVVYEINSGECFYSWGGGEAYLNKSLIKVSANKTLKDSLLGTGFPYYDYSRLDKYLELFKYFMKNTHGVRRPGSAAVDLAYVASGRYDGFYEYGLNPWDVAAGAFLVEQAGGIVSDFKGKSDYLFGKEIIASNNNIFGELQSVIKDFLL